MTTTNGPVIPDAAVEAATEAYGRRQIEGWVEWWDILAAAYPHIRAAVLAEVEAAMFAYGNVRLIKQTYGGHFFLVGTEGDVCYPSLADLLDAAKEAADGTE